MLIHLVVCFPTRSIDLNKYQSLSALSVFASPSLGATQATINTTHFHSTLRPVLRPRAGVSFVHTFQHPSICFFRRHPSHNQHNPLPLNTQTPSTARSRRLVCAHISSPIYCLFQVPLRPPTLNSFHHICAGPH
jgi:hypothetical protein